MDRILRGVIQVGGNPAQEDCHWSWIKLQEHPLEFQSEEDRKIYKYLEDFYQQMSAPPDYALVKEFFENQDDIETTARLEEVKVAQCYIRENYLSIIRAELDRQQVKGVILLCRDASAIAEHGRNLDKPIDGKKILRGVHDAVNYLYGELHQFTKIEGGEKLEGVVTDDADEFLEEYELIEKTNQFANRNLFGFEPVDSVCRGHRIGEFWVHCGFAGHLKSTVAMNYAYNNVMVYGKNIFYGILEMPYSQLRRNFYVIHSSHGKFVTEWYPEDGYTGLDYRQVRDGELNKRDRERLRIVSRDFHKSAKGRLYIWRPDKEVTIDEIRRKAEMFHNKWGCDGIIIDHLGLVMPSRGSRDYVVAVNSVVREARMLALNFARGRAVPLLALFQINRQGLLRAEKNEGRYDFAAISYANEIEKSADVITTTYLDDQLRKEGKFKMGNLKNRDNPHFDMMIGKILWKSKRMRAIEPHLIDLDNSQLLSACDQITMEDIYSSVA
jgi:replicative DNA helicase